MNITIRPYESVDEEAARSIWNIVVEAANAFPQTERLEVGQADAFFRAQTYTAVAEGDDGTIVGLYILHPNNVGRCGHIANASYAVDPDVRGVHIGEKLVKDCMARGRDLGFRILQFNAVVATNIHAIHLYERLGFTRLGTVPGGFRLADDTYEDIILFYHTL